MAAKKPKGILSKGEGASNFVPSPASKTNSDKFNDVVSAAIDTTETAKDKANIGSIISAAGRKYNIDKNVVEKVITTAQGSQADHHVTDNNNHTKPISAADKQAEAKRPAVGNDKSAAKKANGPSWNNGYTN